MLLIHLRRIAALTFAFAFAFIGCRGEFQGECPDDWNEATAVNLGCVQPTERLTSKFFGNVLCIRCEQVPECAVDADCVRSGCSGEVCGAEPVETICAPLPSNACYDQPFARCRCLEGQCGWEPNTDLDICLSRTTPPQ